MARTQTHEILRLGVVALGAALLAGLTPPPEHRPLAPLSFYPFSKTLWVAIELTLRPIDEAEPSDVRLDRADHRSVEGAPR